MRNLNLTLVPLGIVLLVAGCGGGGGSTGDNTNIPTAAVQITSSNAQTVASGANTAAQTTVAQGGGGATTVVGAVALPNGHLPSVLSIATSEFKRALNTRLPPATVVGALPSETINCTTGDPAIAGAANTLTYSYTVAGSTIVAGDSVTMSYTTCALGGVTMNGSMSFAITTLSGGNFGTEGTSAGFTMTFGNFSASGGGESFSLNGDMTIFASSTVTETTATISGDIFTMSFTSGGTTDSMQLTNYNETYTQADTGAFSYTVDMTLAGTAMGGSITIATTTQFTGNTGLNSGNPTAGVMTISGASGSSLTITANATDVTYSGTDGTTPFGPTTVAWSAL